MYQNELVLAKAAMEKESELSNQRLSQHKMTWLDEKTQLERRLDEREGQARQAQKQRDDTTNAHAKVNEYIYCFEPNDNFYITFL